MEEKYTVEELLKLLNVKMGTLRVIIRKNKLEKRLDDIGYILANITEQDNKKIYHLIKVREVKNTEIYKNDKGYVDMTNCIKEGTQINWKKSIGKHITGCYKNIDFDFEIVDYDSKHNKLTILLNGEEKELYYSDIKHFKGFDMLFGIKSFNFKYEIGERIIDYKDDGTIKRDYTIIDRKKGKDSTGHSWKYYKVKCNKCGFDGGEHYYNGECKEEYWIKEAQIKNKYGLGCCSSQFCVKGINDMWTTNPDIAELLSNKEDGYKYTMGTGTKLYFKCPYCGRDNLIQPVNVKKFNKVNCTCSDGVSYPEKFMVSLLEQLNIEFIKEIKFDWCNYVSKVNYKNDIYIKVTDLEDNLLGVYRGYKELQDISKEQFEYHLEHKKLFSILNSVKTDVYGNLKINFSTKKEYENNLNNRKHYVFKNKYIKMIYNNKVYYFDNASRCAEYLNDNFNFNTSSSTIARNCKLNIKFYNTFDLSYIYLTEKEYLELK